MHTSVTLDRRARRASTVVECIIIGCRAAKSGVLAHLHAAAATLPSRGEGCGAAVLGSGAELGQPISAPLCRELLLRTGIVEDLDLLARRLRHQRAQDGQ
jgi:hypothetical protein